MIGGEQVRRAIIQCDRLGYSGEIWPVNPNREQIESRECFRSLCDLPQTPDAAFIAVPKDATVEAAEYLSSIGTGGVVCYASGFAEVGKDGELLQKRLEAVSETMPLIGPNCYGLLNFQDGVALWPDEQGGRKCEKGVAIISQSGNISINLTMQRRGVPIAFLISTGNMAGLKTHDYINIMLDNPDVTAIGLYLEKIPDAEALSEAAIGALEHNIPIVVLQAGFSEVGSSVTMTHSHSMSGDRVLSSAYYEKFGMIQVHSIPQFLETLKFLSVLEPVAERTISSISCSGGEAALVADIAESFGLEFPEFTSAQESRLNDVLGDRVVISNPLDYHTYIWGRQSAQKACFQAVFEGGQATNIKVFDYPAPGICDTTEWDFAVEAIIDAKRQTNARVAVVATLHENFSENVQQKLIENGIAPMLGMYECMQVISDCAGFASVRERLRSLRPLTRANHGHSVLLNEHEAKQLLQNFGVRTVRGQLASDFSEAICVTRSLSYPVVAKVCSSQIVHKTEVDGVIVNIQSDESLNDAVVSLSRVSRQILIEEMASQPALELLVGIRNDEHFGRIMIIGQGGKLTELIGDMAILFFPVQPEDIRQALTQLKIGGLFSEFRDECLNLDKTVATLVRIADLVTDDANRISELEINPLFVYSRNQEAIVVDAVIRRFE
ncbi:MAG: acetate--CoA ligase family protein [Acidiferrobacterales bacterium]|nr:acetate--CoA ligase family protein [Acidiferrobacterales bacterium]